MATSWPVRRTTSTFSMDGQSASATSALAFIGMSSLAPRRPVSCVTSILQAESWMRSRSESGENAPNTTECTAPMRAHASMTTGSSGTICM